MDIRRCLREVVIVAPDEIGFLGLKGPDEAREPRWFSDAYRRRVHTLALRAYPLLKEVLGGAPLPFSNKT